MSIRDLSDELLAKILEDEVLSAKDHTSALKVCRKFKDTIEWNRKCSFSIDAPAHPTWKLARCLLEDPCFGEQIVDITVKWQRRKLYKPETHTTDWLWTPDEKQKISEICQRWEINKKTMRLILGGGNSEALLPLILCFTPRLKSLDLVDVDTNILVFDVENRTDGDESTKIERALGILRGGQDHGLDWTGSSDDEKYDVYDDENEDDEEEFEQFRKYYVTADKYESWNHSILLFQNLQFRWENNVTGSTKLFPRLANLRYFSMGTEDWRDAYVYGQDEATKIRYWDVYPVLLFPRIQTIRFFANTGFIGDYLSNGRPLSNPKQPVPRGTGPSTVKRLKLLTPTFGRHRKESYGTYFKQISRVTGNLEWVYLRTRKPDNPWNAVHERAAFPKAMVKHFLHHNKRTLKDSRILVDGAGFNQMGVFWGDEEIRRTVIRKQREYELHRAKYPPY